MRNPIRSRSKRTGVAMTELALIAPFLGLLFMVGVDYCRIFRITQTLDDCARNAALYASGAVDPNPNTFDTVADAALQVALDEGSNLSPMLATQNVSISTTSSAATVTVSYTFQTLTRIPGMAASYTVQRTAVVPIVPKSIGYSYGSGADSSGSNSGGGHGRCGS